VCNNASLNSARSTCPLSSSSNAEKADKSSEGGDNAVSSVASELRKEGSVRVCGVEGGKNEAISDGVADNPN